MKNVHIDASRSYDVRIGRGLLDDCGRQIAERVRCASAAVVTDDTVYALYGERVCASLEAAGVRTVCYVFPHGEKSKNLLEYAKILNFLAENRVTRADALIALGGGVTGDLAGFAAATVKDANDVEVRLAQSPPDDDIREPHFVIEIFPIFLPWTVEETKAKQ